MFDPTPWMVRSARHSAALGRFVVHSLSGGAQGVIEPSDLKVSPLGVSGASVIVGAGGAFVRNTYGGASQQTYAVRNAAALTVPIAPNTGGTARYDLVVVRIQDPEYHAGLVVPDPLTFQYVDVYVVQNVPANTTSVTVGMVPGNPPCYVLARVLMPAGGASVSAGQITDLRRVANPRTQREMFSVYGEGGRMEGHEIPTAGYDSWPITEAQRPLVWVPEWATHMNIVGLFSGVYYVKYVNTDTVAGIRTGFADSPAQHGIIIEDGNSAGGRFHYSVVGDHEVPAAKRGTYQYVDLEGVRTAGTGFWYSDYQTSISIDVQFTERAS